MTMPPLPESFTILSRLKSGTEEVVSLASAIEYGAACAAAERERCAKIAENTPTTLLRELAADPVVNQSLTTEPVARPPTPIGWSDTDWVKHLECMLPIGYAVRDTLYGTSKAGVLRFCSSTEAGAFAIYTAPQQRKPLTQDEVLDMAEGCTLQFHDLLAFARAIEQAHGITGEQK